MASALLSCAAQSNNKALLIGVGDYLGDQFDLEGPKHDIKALTDVLQKSWGFKADNIVTLVDSDATRSNILKALTRLKNGAKAEDQIFIYFSGHGTSVRDTDLGLPLPYSSGAIVPQDFSNKGTKKQMLAQLIVGKHDLKPILLALDATQAQTFVAFDSCYSGNSVRGLYADKSRLRTREMPLGLSANDEFDVDSFDDEEDAGFSSGITETDAYPYKNIYFLSAANSSETALDLGVHNFAQYPTIDNKPHGAFTDSLLRALTGELHTDINGDGKINYSELHTAIKNFMKESGYHHTPQVLPALAEDKQLLRLRNVLGQKKIAPVSRENKSSALLTVHVGSNERDLTSRLKQLSQIELVNQNAELNLKKQGNNTLLINKSGDLLGTLHSPSLQQIVGRVKQEAWKKHFSYLLQKRASINIDFSLQDSINGSTAIEGDLIAFTLRSDTPIHLLLLDVDSHGTLTTLYPYQSNELQAIAANQLKYIPGENKRNWIRVQKPFGTDHLIAIGFAQQPAFLKGFVGKETLNLQSDLYKQLVEYLKAEQYGYNELDLLTIQRK